MDFLNKAIRSLSKLKGEVNMSEKTILKLNSTASILPTAWLALAILAVGAFGNSVQAQVVWLNDTLSGYTTDGVALTTTASPQLVATPGSTWTVLGAGSPKKLRTYKPAGAASPYTSTVASSTSRLTYKLSSDAANTTDRGPVGYLSYKVTPNSNAALTHLFNADAANSSWMEVGLGTTGTDALASGSQTFLSARFYYNLASVTPQFSVGFYMNNADLQVNPFGTSKTAITSGANTIKIWYNKSASGVSYTPPGSSSSVTLAANSWVAYVNDAIATGFQQTGLTFLNPVAYSTATITAGATTSSAVGKLGVYNGASGHTYDFSLSDIYVADSAPAATSAPILTTNPIPVTVQAGTTVTNTISFGGNPAPVFSKTGTWPSWAALSSNGVAVFSPYSSETVATNSFTFTATNSAGSTNGMFNVSVTAAASVAPVINSPSTVSGKLAWPYTSTTTNALYQITTDIPATGYSYSGTLPAGLQFDTVNGRIYGTPTALASNTPVSLIASAGALSSTSSVSISIVASTWSGASANWSDTTAWTDGVVPQSSISSANGSVAIFGATTGAGANSVVVGDKSIYGLIFNSDANAYTFSAAVSTNSFTLSNLAGIANNSTATHTFNNKVMNVGGNGTWASSTTSGALVFNGGIDISGTGVPRTLTLGGVGPITVASSITDGTATNPCSISIANTGLTTFSGANTYAGLTTVATGANLKLGNVAALGTATGATAVSGTLDLFGFSPAAENFTLSGGSIVNSGSVASTIDGTIGLTGTANVINTSNADINLSGVISGSLGSFAKNGANTLTLTGLNTFTGGLTLNAGTVIGNSDSPFGTYNSGTSINLLGGNLIVQNTNAVGYGPTGAGGVRPRLNLGGGQLTAQTDLTLNANSSTSGQVTISAASTISVASNKTVRIERMVATDNTNAANSFLTKTGPGTLSIIGSASTVIGGYRVNEGILAFNGSANAGMGSGPIVMNGGSLLVSKGAGSSGQYSGFSITNLLSLQQDTVNYFEPNINSPAGYNVMSVGSLNLNGYKLTYMRTNTNAWGSYVQTDPTVTFRSASLSSAANTLDNNTSLVLVLQGASGTGGLTKTGTGTLVLSDQPNQTSPSAVVAGGVVTGINLPDNAMKGFTGTPSVTIAAPMNNDGTPVVGGTTATATATVSNGVITTFTITSGGSGYLSAPQVTVTPDVAVTTNTYNGATLVQSGKLNLSGSSSSSISFASGTTLELNYQAPSEASAALDSGVATMPLKGISMAKSFAGYTSAPTVTIGAPQNLDGTLIANGVAATATAQVANGRIVGFTITSPGSGYSLVQRPSVTIAPPQQGTVVATTTGSLNFAEGSRVRVTMSSAPTAGSSYTLVTASGGITGTPVLETSIPGYALTKSSDGKSLLLEQLDTTKPVITLIGSSSVNVNYGASYTDLGATVDDNKDATRSINGTGSVNTSVPGSYTITFNATDAAGNVADTVTRTVVVGAAPDTTKPVIALIGSSTVNVDYGASYADLGATVTDNKDATRSINGVGSVNTLVPGSYTITFNATDAAGNVADTVTRMVVVGPAPVTDGYAVYLSSNGLPAGTAFNAKVNGVTAGLVYAFGSSNGSPRNNGVTAIPVMSGSQLTYTFDVKDDSALTVTYQTSADLLNWTAAQSVSAGTGSSPAGFVKKQAQVTGSAKLFVRINVTHP